VIPPRRAGSERRFWEALRALHPGRFAPLAGAAIGAAAAVVYWLAAQVWPSSVAVVLAMLTSALLAENRTPAPLSRADLSTLLFFLLIKYSALMALSAAKLPFAVPPNVALGLIMVCGHAASRSLRCAALGARGGAAPSSAQFDQALALLLGFAPSALLGIPGLVGLAAAIMVSIGCVYQQRLAPPADASRATEALQYCAEVAFYLGALASWSYIA
jgi:cobalamin synthase